MTSVSQYRKDDPAVSDKRVKVEKDGDITIVTLDDGKANVFATPMAQQLQEAFDSIDKNSGAVIVTGRPKFFSAGFDLKTIASGDPDAGRIMTMTTLKMAMGVLSFPRPVIGACPGHCMAMGALFILTMDYRIGVRGKYKIGLNEVRDGMSLPVFGIELPRFRLKSEHLIASTLHSKLYEADGAVEAGFLDEAVEADALMDTALERARHFAGLPNPMYHATKMNVVGELHSKILKSMGLED